MKFRLTVAAAADVQSISAYLSAESPTARLGFEARLAQVFLNIREYPLTGRLTDRPQIRIVNTHPYPYIIYYRVGRMEILVVRILHGARNPRAMPARPS